MSLHLCPIEPHLEPEDGEVPWEGVEHPRARRAGKRDRFEFYWRARQAINEREAKTVRDFGDGWSFPTSLSFQSWYANHAQHEVRRALWGIDDLGRMHPKARRAHLDRLWRYVRKVRALRLAGEVAQ